MSWSNRYIGLPYVEFGRGMAGVDCWGLVVVVYLQELGITLPDYLGYASAEEHAEIDALIAGAEQSPSWVAADTPAPFPAPFDIAVFRRGHLASHIGIVVQRGIMLHMVGQDCAKLEAYTTGRWGNRLKGIYRHVHSEVRP